MHPRPPTRVLYCSVRSGHTQNKYKVKPRMASGRFFQLVKRHFRAAILSNLRVVRGLLGFLPAVLPPPKASWRRTAMSCCSRGDC